MDGAERERGVGGVVDLDGILRGRVYICLCLCRKGSSNHGVADPETGVKLEKTAGQRRNTPKGTTLQINCQCRR